MGCPFDSFQIMETIPDPRLCNCSELLTLSFSKIGLISCWAIPNAAWEVGTVTLASRVRWALSGSVVHQPDQPDSPLRAWGNVYSQRPECLQRDLPSTLRRTLCHYPWSTISSTSSSSFIKSWSSYRREGKEGKGSGVWPSMVTHTRNLSSAFNPSKCTLTAVNTHLEQWAAILRRPGSSWGIGALLKGLTSVVVLKVERALVIHSPHRQSLPDLGIEPATFGLQVQLSNH